MFAFISDPWIPPWLGLCDGGFTPQSSLTCLAGNGGGAASQHGPDEATEFPCHGNQGLVTGHPACRDPHESDEVGSRPSIS